jgi:hypothetical protein
MGLKINIPEEPDKEVVEELVSPNQPVATSPYWAQAKLRYMERNLDENAVGPYTMKQLAEDMHLNYGSLRQVAFHEKWNSELEVLRTKKHNAILNRIVEMQVLSEIDIRLRQAHVARLAQSKAYEHLSGLDPTKMTTKNAIALLALGLEQERKALGMATTPQEGTFDKDKEGKTSLMEEASKIIENAIASSKGMKDVN